MTTVLQIISDAYRQSNLIGVGASPTSSQITEALRYFNRIIKSVFGREVGEDFQDVFIDETNISRNSIRVAEDLETFITDYYIPQNTRIILNLTEATTLFLHPNPRDGARLAIVDVGGNLATTSLTLNGNGRKIEDSLAPLVCNVNNTNKEWFYRADLGDWVAYAPLLSTDSFPFPVEFEDYFVTLLSIRLNPSYGVALDGQSDLFLRSLRTQLKSRYRQSSSVSSEIGLARLSNMTSDRGFEYSSTTSGDDRVFFTGD